MILATPVPQPSLSSGQSGLSAGVASLATSASRSSSSVSAASASSSSLQSLGISEDELLKGDFSEPCPQGKFCCRNPVDKTRELCPYADGVCCDVEKAAGVCVLDNESGLYVRSLSCDICRARTPIAARPTTNAFRRQLVRILSG